MERIHFQNMTLTLNYKITTGQKQYIERIT